MSFDWTAYQRLAESLAQIEGNVAKQEREAAARSAISRAYYACAMVARARLRSRGVVLSRSRSVHQEITAWLLASDDRNDIDAGTLLMALRKERNCADYHDHYVGVRMSRKSVLKARRCLELLAQ